MSKYYRFRSAERLLGRPATADTPARPGELDDLTIYFASPQELNDPLEGFRETNFQGDIIVWRNLLKHYTMTLYAMVLNVYTEEGDGGTIHINLRPNNFPPQSRSLLQEIFDLVLSSTPIKSYIESIVSTNRIVSRLELSVHFTTMHNAILSYIMDKLDGPIEIPDAPAFKAVQKNVLDFISIRSHEILAEGRNPTTSIYSNFKSKIKQQALRGNAARESNLSKGKMRLLIGFPEEFCQQLEYLMFPHWYVACFMKSCANSSIWGSYGDNHKGICLIYKSRKFRGSNCLTLSKLPLEFVQAYNALRPKEEYHLTMPLQLPLTDVSYSAAYSKPNFFTSIINEQKEWALSYWYTDESGTASTCATWLYNKPSEMITQYKDEFQKSCTTKMAHWENESESRVIILGLPWKPEERLARYSFSELDGLIFGINTSDETKFRVIRKIAEHCAEHRRSDFKFYQARFDESYSSIEHDHLEYITFNPDGTLNIDPQIG